MFVKLRTDVAKGSDIILKTMKETISTKAFKAGGIQNLTPTSAFDACKNGLVLIDVREEYLTDYKVFDVPNYVLCPFSKIEEWLKSLPIESSYIVADASGLRSHEAILKMDNYGFKQVFNLAGGLVDWERSKLPVRMDIRERLTGSCMCQLKPRDKKK